MHDLGEPGLLFGPRETRLYPNGAVAAHVLGGASFGREGVHAAEVSAPPASSGSSTRGCAIRRRWTSRCGSRSTSTVQTALEEVLAQGMAEMNAKGAVGILMEADTGQIRALASLPDFDPNLRPPLPTKGDPADSPLFNRAAQGRYELGSTFKPFTVAMALEAGLVSPQTLVDTKSPMRCGRFTIRDFHDYGPRLTVEDVLVKSSNIGAAHIGMMLGADAAAGVPRPDRAARGLAGRAPRGGAHRAAAAGALVRPVDDDDLLRPRHGGDAAAPRGRLRDAGERRPPGATEHRRERRAAGRGRPGDLGAHLAGAPRHAAAGGGARHRAGPPTSRATRSAARPAPPTSRTPGAAMRATR